MQYETRRLSIAETQLAPAHQIHAQIWNPASGNAVLCMHGLTRNAHDFDFLAERLSQDYCVIALDMPGRGQSDAFSDKMHYHYGVYLADTLSALAQLGLSSVHWLGTSMGGIIGMMAANAAPQMIRSLTLNDIGCLIPAGGLSRILSYAGVHTRFATQDEAEQMMRRNCLPFGIPSDDHWQHLFKHGIVQDEEGFRFAYDPNITASFRGEKPTQDVNLWPLWEKVKPIPTLLLRGESSDILTHETALSMQAEHPKLHYETIKDCGHAPALMSEEQKSLIHHWISAQVNS
jgi:pimeloyl-ACP methyl ester carboxylesterase